MYISIDTIVAKMEEELQQIKKEMKAGEQNKIQDHSKILKAYCELLIDSPPSKRTDETEVKRVTTLHNSQWKQTMNKADSLLDF